MEQARGGREQQDVARPGAQRSGRDGESAAGTLRSPGWTAAAGPARRATLQRRAIALQRLAGNRAVAARIEATPEVAPAADPVGEPLVSEILGSDARAQSAARNAPPLTVGESSSGVRALQDGLAAVGLPLPRSSRPDGTHDGVYGAETQAAVRRFQTEHGVRPVGGHEAGRKTLHALDRLLGAKPPVPPVPPVPPQPQARRLLVDTPPELATPGQMTVGTSLPTLRQMVTAEVAALFTGTKFTVDNCPYIAFWFDFYGSRPAERVERAVRIYGGPAVDGAATAADYMQPVVRRVATGVTHWLATREVTEVPPDVDPDHPSEPAEAVLAPGSAADAAAPAGGETPPAVLPAPVQRLDAAAGRVAGLVGGGAERARVHDDPAAHALAAAHGARAVTVGEDVSFAVGEYRPGTPRGDALLAHELAHVRQQAGAPAGEVASGGVEDVEESEADVRAVGAVGELWAGASAIAQRLVAGLPALRTGLRLRRCSVTPPEPEPDPHIAYQREAEKLRKLFAERDAFEPGKGRSLDDIQGDIDSSVRELHRQGLRLDENQLHDALADKPAAPDLLVVKGRISRDRTGPMPLDADGDLRILLDYVPPGRAVRTEWFATAGGKQCQVASRGTDQAKRMDEAFWTAVNDEVRTAARDSRQITFSARVYLGDDKTPQTETFSDPVPLSADPAGNDLTLVAEPAQVLPSSSFTVHFAAGAGPRIWTPRQADHFVNWSVNGVRHPQKRMLLPLTAPAQAGQLKVRGELFAMPNGLKGNLPLVGAPETVVTITDPGLAGRSALEKLAGGPQVSTADLRAELDAQIRHTQEQASAGGELQKVWDERTRALQKKKESLDRAAGGRLAKGGLVPWPTTGALDPATTYTAPLPAVLVVPAGDGVQPLTMSMVLSNEAGRWLCQLVDSTSTDVFTREGTGTDPGAAYREAIRAWSGSNPYPGGSVFDSKVAAPHVQLKTPALAGLTPGVEQFATFSAFKQAKSWVDGIAVSLGVLALGLAAVFDPEPATKALAAAAAVAAVASATLHIADNISLDIPATDTRNIIEGVSIVLTAAGFAGSQLRSLGMVPQAAAQLTTTSDRLGKTLLLSSIAGDAAVNVFVAADSIAHLRAIKDDPELADDKKRTEAFRIISSLLTSLAMFVISNKDAVRRGIDLAKMRRRAGQKFELPKGSRKRVQAELARFGDPKARVPMPDAELLDRHDFWTWASAGGLDRSRSLELLAAIDLETLSGITRRGFDPKAFAAAARRLGALIPGHPAGPIAAELSPAQFEAFTAAVADRAATVRIDPRGLVVFGGGELAVHPSRLADLPPGELRDVVEVADRIRAGGNALQETTGRTIEREGRTVPETWADVRDRIQTGQRIRFAPKLAEAERVLADLGLNAASPGADGQMIFANLTAEQRFRLVDLRAEVGRITSADRRNEITRHVLRQSRSSGEFVSRWQQASSVIAEARTRLAERFAQLRLNAQRRGLTGREEILDAADTLTREQQREHNDRGIEFMKRENESVDDYLAKIEARTVTMATVDADMAALRPVMQARLNPGARVDPTLPPEQLVAAARRTRPSFGDVEEAAYHARKHLREIREPRDGRDDGTFYHDALDKTITDGTVQPVDGRLLNWDQFGRSRTFLVVRDGVTAFVRVDREGRVFVSSYFRK